jgi:hypothetical protein
MNRLRDFLTSAQNAALSGGYLIALGIGTIVAIAYLTDRM